MAEMLEIEFLGTGTSTGVPVLRCPCPVCHSSDEHDHRLRASAIIRYLGKRILIDCGPDFRTQMLRASDINLDALLITHVHYDHVGGIDDLRSYCFERDFPVYAQADVIKDFHQRLPYCFAEHLYPGVPKLDVHEVKANEPFMVEGIEVMPLPVMHYQLPILGYRIGPLAYITDAKTIPQETIDAIKGVPLLVLNALRHKPHMSHLSLSDALKIINEVKPGRALLTHMSHEIGFHTDINKILPPNVQLAHDTQIVTVAR